MKNKTLKLHMKIELAYEVILYSLIFICIGIAYVFASNLLTFNWFTVAFALIAIALIVLKHKSYFKIKEDTLSTYYFHFFRKDTIEMRTVDAFLFYASGTRVELMSNDQAILVLYLKEKNKTILMNWLMHHYPEIPCYVQESK